MPNLVIGLVGRVCAGKSAVADAFRRRGAWVYDADKVVHELYKKKEVIEQVRELFGDTVLNPEGGIDRKALGKLVFADPLKLRTLTERVIFPRTREMLDETLQAFRNSSSPALILDAPTLFEAGRDQVCQFIAFVTAPLARRQAWAQARGWEKAELELRDARLGDETIKRQHTTEIIDNTGSLEDMDRRVGELFDRWKSTQQNQGHNGPPIR